MGSIVWGAVLVGIIVIATGVIVLRGPLRRLGIDESVLPAASAVVLRVRVRHAAAVVAAVLVGIAVIVLGAIRTQDMGVLFPLAPLLAALVAIMFLAFAPTFRETSPVRRADLAPRTIVGVTGARIWAVAAALIVAAGIVIALGVSANEDGRSITRRIDVAQAQSTAGPYPGFFYGLPVLVLLALLAVAVVVTLRRLAAAPRPTDESLREADETIRRYTATVIVHTVSGAVAGALAGLLFAASSSTNSISYGIELLPEGSGNVAADPVLAALALVELIGAAALGIACTVLVIRAVSIALRTPLAVVAREAAK